jgi:hypothetical protein
MKKNYIYLLILLIATVGLTFLLSSIYSKEVNSVSYSYEKLNKITSVEFEEYMIENTETIIYVSDKNDLSNNKFEKKFIKKLESLNLLENTIYIEKDEVTNKFKELLKTNYNYKIEEKKLPIIIVIDNGEILQNTVVSKNSNVETIIDYGVFE